jgi:hypothetical protein
MAALPVVITGLASAAILSKKKSVREEGVIAGVIDTNAGSGLN